MVNRNQRSSSEESGQVPDQAIREQLDDLIRKSGQGYAEISRLLGRNPAYIQQYIRRGVPRRLGEMERRILAQHFSVPESLLGAPPAPIGLQPDPASHPLLDIGYAGGVPGGILLDSRLLPGLAPAQAANLVAHVVEGDSMAPTLLSGDHLLVDQGNAALTRDGLYLIETESSPAARRLAINPVTRRVAILSDNAAYPSYPDCDPSAMRVLGRVIWVARALA
jgi:SOS-response transcriptional repressor LexA